MVSQSNFAFTFNFSLHLLLDPIHISFVLSEVIFSPDREPYISRMLRFA